MNISPFDFHNEAYNMISTTVTGARDYGLDVSTLPPHLSIMTGDDLLHNKVMLGFSLPEILQDVNPEFWSFIAHQKMYEEEKSIGFVFWCLIEDSRSGEQSIFGMSYFKGEGFEGFLSDIDFQSEPSLLTDPHQIVPSFLGYDFEVDCLVH
jgi:hypothetical protein